GARRRRCRRRPAARSATVGRSGRRRPGRRLVRGQNHPRRPGVARPRRRRPRRVRRGHDRRPPRWRSPSAAAVEPRGGTRGRDGASSTKSRGRSPV
ncbi:MAG: hypothetical protein AVDCRST_MAG73-2865, partial [uncultured Thermomicrobiales bacterium]